MPEACIRERVSSVVRLGIAALAIACAWTRIYSADVLFHVAAGRRALETGALPRVDDFSFTAHGAPWENHSWLFDVVLASVVRLMGLPGVAALQTLATLGLAALTFRLDPKLVRRPAALVAFAVAVFAYREVINGRPQLVAFACVAASLVLLRGLLAAGAIDRAARLRLGAALATHAVWAGCHASHVLFFPMILAGVVNLGWRGERVRALALAAVGVVAFGVGLVVAPNTVAVASEHASSAVMQRYVAEWLPTDVAFLTTTLPGIAFAVLALVSMAGALHARVRVSDDDGLPPQEIRAHDLALLVLFAAFGLTARRLTAFFVLGALPLTVPYVAHALRTLTRAMARGSVGRERGIAALASLAVVLSLMPIALRPTPQSMLGTGLVPGRFPVQAVATMRGNAIAGRFFHPFGWGGYLMYAGYPPEGVFVDGRAITVYPPELVAESFDAIDDPRVFERLADRFALDGALVRADASPLTHYLTTSTRWQLVYRDHVAALFLRAPPS